MTKSIRRWQSWDTCSCSQTQRWTQLARSMDAKRKTWRNELLCSVLAVFPISLASNHELNVRLVSHKFPSIFGGQYSRTGSVEQGEHASRLWIVLHETHLVGCRLPSNLWDARGCVFAQACVCFGHPHRISDTINQWHPHTQENDHIYCSEGTYIVTNLEDSPMPWDPSVGRGCLFALACACYGDLDRTNGATVSKDNSCTQTPVARNKVNEARNVVLRENKIHVAA